MKKLSSISFLLCLTNLVFSQQLKASYTPEMIKDSISTIDYDELNPIYSSETKTLYFSRLNHPQNLYKRNKSQDVWSSTLQDDGTWSTPEPLPKNVNNSRYNNVLSVLDNGNTLLLSGYYTKNNRWYERGLSVVTKGNGDNWDKPIQIKVKRLNKVNEGHIMHAHMLQDKSKIYFSFDKRYLGKSNDLWVSHLKKSGTYKAPKKLKIKNEISGKNLAPTLSANGDTLIFAAKNKKRLDFYEMVRDAEDTKFRKWLSFSEFWRNYHFFQCMSG